MLLDITATEAKERSTVPALAVKINKAIREAADKGLQGVRIGPDIPGNLYDELVLNGFDITTMAESTWIWWGA